ncbi:MAG TPA: hypothetical protein VJ302_15000 [Blastocatellia bacterium]|nr:hypothetical protein [Blastocatellia bacterium]
MKWKKLGLIFTTLPDHRQGDWMVSHASVPTALPLANGRIRVYFSPRDIKGRSRPTFIEVDGLDPRRVLYVHDRPVIGLGELGTFDDNGIMPGSIVEEGGKLHLYYVGWNAGVSVPYRNAVGLAISHDGGLTFEKPYPGAVVDRNLREPYFTLSPCVSKVDQQWHLWYGSVTGFIRSGADEKPEPVYVIKYASSRDGIEWERPNLTCIHPHTPDESNARPTVLAEADRFRMWFCFRGGEDFRDGVHSYRIGYAESKDGRAWQRLDELAGISTSEEGWDSKMLAYPSVVRSHGRTYLFYNGNGFGLSGIGCAMAQDD